MRASILKLATKISIECGTYTGVTPNDPEYKILEPVVTDEMAAVIGMSDYLVIESNYDEDMLWTGVYPEYLKKRVSGGNGHLSNKLCAKAIVDNAGERLRRVWLCHLSEENNHPELARKTVEQELSDAGKPWAGSVQVDVLRRNVPSLVFEIGG